MTTTRRDLLKGSVATAAVVMLPGETIPGLTPITTLSQLCVEGKYCSVEHHLPLDMYKISLEWRFHLNGVYQEGIHLMECYAPGDNSGWARVLGPDHTEVLIRGRWTMKRVPATS